MLNTRHTSICVTGFVVFCDVSGVALGATLDFFGADLDFFGADLDFFGADLDAA